jgi:hypothetical protein
MRVQAARINSAIQAARINSADSSNNYVDLVDKTY